LFPSQDPEVSVTDKRDQEKKDEPEVEGHRHQGHGFNDTVDPESPSIDRRPDEDEDEVQGHRHQGHG
jgi:hypothetical protein